MSARHLDSTFRSGNLKPMPTPEVAVSPSDPSYNDQIAATIEPTHSVEISLAGLQSLRDAFVVINANGNLLVTWRGHVCPAFDINFRSGTNLTEAQKTSISRAADRALILTLLT